MWNKTNNLLISTSIQRKSDITNEAYAIQYYYLKIVPITQKIQYKSVNLKVPKCNAVLSAEFEHSGKPDEGLQAGTSKILPF